MVYDNRFIIYTQTMISVEQIVILTTFISIAMLLGSRYRTKNALQWWYETQSIEFNEEAEFAKNGLLQESFFLRRSIELLDGNLTSNSGKVKEKYLNSIEKIYDAVTELINHLSPAYVNDSLPLAIQYLVSAWKIKVTAASWVTKLPVDWDNESPIHSRVLLSLLNRLFQVILSQQQIPQQIQVCLAKQGDLNGVTVNFNYQDTLIVNKIRRIKELDYINKIFAILISGKFYYYQKDAILICRLNWKSDSKLS
ncbi:hypothetical protein DSM106972_072210 [Dulcicalothrix desertica PCC 7102]|uniref:Histidine kinase n=2 Tax=Dulcicalothrix desertica TaxID=32056 RepID=A0A433V3Y8_9CYAN|nr:hypothetical protein DSM106972_072210 [Dulcicalothrix desertica PCC 7102]